MPRPSKEKVNKPSSAKQHKPSALMLQYNSIKKDYPDEIVFFRMGDFYEMMYDDAIKASGILGITLTKRGRGTPGEAPMCGIPHHAADGYVAKLIRAGVRVAICDQVEDPKEAKGLVRREVTRVVTPGTVLDENCMEGKDFQFLAAMIEVDGCFGLALIEFSTGRFEVTEFSGSDARFPLADLLSARDPAELLVPKDLDLSWLDEGFLKQRCITEIEGWNFASDCARKQLNDHFGTLNLDGFGLQNLDLALRCGGAALAFIYQTQKGKAAHLMSLKVLMQADFMILDSTTVRNLELTHSLFDGNREESLLGQIDCCNTAMGSRLLKEWILQPLVNVPAINERLSFLASYLSATIARGEIRQTLAELPDLDRQISKLAMNNIKPRELLGIADALSKIPAIMEQLDQVVPDRYGLDDAVFSRLWGLHDRIIKDVHPEPPPHMRAGGFMNAGVDDELDELRALRTDSRSVLAQVEVRERESTGIPKLKVQYNKVFGYFIEVSNQYKSRVPEHYVRKQTLVNCERYIIEELKEYETKILTAEERIILIEERLFKELLDACHQTVGDLKLWSQILAGIDVHAALAELASSRNYCRPTVTSGHEINIVEGRHAVVESLSTEPFVANDIFLDNQNERVLIITGPNMGGKSTYLRQTALIVLMAQMGSYVPATSAEVGVVDRIFTRVGASDNLARGQSTFMVEMTETANIMNHATARSLIILDEIGRGTSTFDGLSIAWATAEYILDREKIGAKTLFATHYHEMTELERSSEGVRNMHITVREWQNKIVFLRRVEKGAADQSYGIHVAQLAGLPGDLISRAREILANLEKNELDTKGEPKLARKAKAPTPRQQEVQMSLFAPDPSPVLNELQELDLENISPRQALEILYRWRETL